MGNEMSNSCLERGVYKLCCREEGDYFQGVVGQTEGRKRESMLAKVYGHGGEDKKNRYGKISQNY